MDRIRSSLPWLFTLFIFNPAYAASETAVESEGQEVYDTACSFCHGLDASGGTRGPDLIRSELVNAANNTQQFLQLLNQGRPDKGMPAANIPRDQALAVLAFLQDQIELFATNNGGRRAVTPEDLATGDANDGQIYFEQYCTDCHSASGDMAGISGRLLGLPLIRRMLYPGSEGGGSSRPDSKITVLTEKGEQLSGELVYQDEFNVIMLDDDGRHRSWQRQHIDVVINNPLQAHLDQLGRYTDEDIHDVYAYLLTLDGE